MKFYLNIIIYLIAFLFVIACDGKGKGKKMIENEKYQILNFNNSKLTNLFKRKFYFGHMSVGYNIIEGIKDIINEHSSIDLNIVETNNSNDFNKPIFAHSKIGKNMDPKSKIDDFVNFMKNGVGEKVEIAFFKFCYVDFSSDTNVENLFSYYSSAMNVLKKKYPQVKFIHFTVPLSTYKKMNFKEKVKDFIKAAIGKETDKEKHFKNNIERNMFNEILRKHYNEKVLFDLAKLQSTHPDGKKEKFARNGTDFFALVPDYTFDGGHLNNLGQKFIGHQLLIFLSNL